METSRKIYKAGAIAGIALMVIVAITICSSGFKKVEGPKAELTDNEVFYLMQNNNVTGYSFNQGDGVDVVVEREKGAGILEPVINKKVARVIVESSGIEDSKLYSLGSIVFEDGSKERQVLFINDPLTLDWVAISIEKNGINNLFTFYNNGVDVYGNKQY